MITYDAIWCGPISNEWCENNGHGWSGGRIDVHGTGEDYPLELDLPMMLSEDWSSFSNWLYDVRTQTVYTVKQLVEEYEKNHRPIKWFLSTKCPRCKGPADNGDDGKIPPTPNWCSKCEVEVFAVGGG